MQKTNKIILFDIDHTIFNANLYRSNLYANLARGLGYDVNEFSKTAQKEYEKFRKTTYYFTPELFLKTILTHSKNPNDLKKAKPIFWDKTLYEACIFPDVKKAFSYLAEKNIQIGIFSTGDLEHQKIKIESLKEYLLENHIYISPNKLEIIKSTFDKYDKHRIYLVDDYPQILESAKDQNKDIFTVFIKRNESYPGLIVPENFKPDATIADLSQLTAIIRTNN